MTYIKVNTPEYLVTAKDVIDYLKGISYSAPTKINLWFSFISESNAIVAQVIDNMYGFDYNENTIDEESLEELKNEIHDYLFK